MMIPEEIQRCAVFLRYNSSHGLKWAGTGFFVSVKPPCQDPNAILSYLVTARHVLEEIRTGANDGKVRVRVNLLTGESDDVSIPIGEWQHHPQDHIDLSAICFSPLGRDAME